MMLSVAALVESRFDRIGNTFIADGRGEAAPRSRCHSFGFRTATHEREFKPPSRTLAGTSAAYATSPRDAVPAGFQSDIAACHKAPAPVPTHPEPEANSAPIQYPTLLGGARFVMRDNQKGGECKPSTGVETAVLTSTAPPATRRWKTDAGVLLEAVSAPEAEAPKEPEKAQGATADLALPICKRSRRKQKTPTAGCETPSTAASSTTASPAKGGSFQGASPSTAAATTKAKRPDRLVQEDLIRQLMQTGASAMARANVIAKDMAAA